MLKRKEECVEMEAHSNAVQNKQGKNKEQNNFIDIE